MKATTNARPKAAPVVAYKRPEPTYRPAIGKTAEKRLATLRATLHAADEKIEAAYDAVERGTVVDTLLHLVAHDLLCTAMHPVTRNEDEAGIPVTKADLDVAYEALLPVLASLEGAMVLSMGSVISSTLVEAFQLLNWAQGECDGAALGKLLPDFDEEAAFNRGRDLAIDMLKEGQRQYSLDSANGMRMLRPCTDDGHAPQQDAFVRQFLEQVANDPTLVAGFDAVLSAALSEDPVYIPDGYRVPMAEFQAGKPGDDGTEASMDSTPDDTAEVATVATSETPMADWLQLSLTQGAVEDAKMLVDMIFDACQWHYADPAESELAQGRIILLSRAVEGYLSTAQEDLGARVAQLQEQRR